MIKINLLRNVGMTTGGITPQSAGVALSPDLQKAALGRLAIIALFPLAVFAYEKFNLSVLQGEVDKVNAQITDVNAQKASFGSVAPKVEKFTKEKKEIVKQVEAVRELARNRLREVKTLDALQSFMPDQAWLSDLQINGSVVKLDGFTLADDGVTRLIKALESSVLFSQITPKSTSKVDLPAGPAKKFQLEFRVGKKE